MFRSSLLQLIALFGMGISAYAQSDSLARDSVRQAYLDEFDFIVDQIEHHYVSGRRGIGNEAWNRRQAQAREEFAQLLDINIVPWWGWRNINWLTDDGHFEFPDNGSFNRHNLFAKNELVFPLWVQIWKDGTLYNVHDYTGTIPPRAEIVGIMRYYNGQYVSTLPARLLGKACLDLTAGEPVYAWANSNATHQPNPRDWMSFANYLSFFSASPWGVIYKAPDSERTDTVLLHGMSREQLYKLYRKTGNRRRVQSESGLAHKPITYANLGNGTGVLTINSFWGKRWSHMLLFGKDWRYKRLLRRAMRRINRDGIDNLVIDVSRNAGGMAENVYYTLDYLTDRPIDIAYTYRITDACRENALTVLERSPFLAEADRQYLTGYIDTVASGSRFRTDTIRPMQYVPQPSKHRYTGNVYVLTSHQTYSAAEMFVLYCQQLGLGAIAGQHCGGYRAVTGGNTGRVTLPVSTWMEFRIPYREEVCLPDAPSYEYPEVDIPIDHPFDEWLRRESHSLDRLLEIIDGDTPSAAIGQGS